MNSQHSNSDSAPAVAPQAITTPRSSRRRWALGITGMILLAVIVFGAVNTARYRIRKLCRAAQLEERWQDLEGWSRTWADFEPSEADAWLFLADAVQHQNRFLEAAEYLAEVPSTSP